MRRGLFLFLFAASACGHGLADSDATRVPLGYAASSAWLCLPDRPGDPCRGDLTATEIRTGGTRVVVDSKAIDAPKVDCFYVYPTVDLQLAAGNHSDFTDERIRTVVLTQAARFREACAVYAPFYRQVTIGTYLRPREQLEAGLAIGYADIEQAFRRYLATYNHGRKIVLVGHSQGAEMVVRLVKEFFDGNGQAEMRRSLLLAMAIGGNVYVPKGKVVGGTFANVPVCTDKDETSCVVAYRSHLASQPVKPWGDPLPPGDESVCVDPADIVGATPHAFSRAVFPAQHGELGNLARITTPFVVLPDFYVGHCEDGPNGYRYLAISATPQPGDDRSSPIDFDRNFSSRSLLGGLGLHIFDLQIPQGDLIDMVASRAAALP